MSRGEDLARRALDVAAVRDGPNLCMVVAPGSSGKNRGDGGGSRKERDGQEADFGLAYSTTVKVTDPRPLSRPHGRQDSHRHPGSVVDVLRQRREPGLAHYCLGPANAVVLLNSPLYLLSSSSSPFPSPTSPFIFSAWLGPRTMDSSTTVFADACLLRRSAVARGLAVCGHHHHAGASCIARRCVQVPRAGPHVAILSWRQTKKKGLKSALEGDSSLAICEIRVSQLASHNESPHLWDLRCRRDIVRPKGTNSWTLVWEGPQPQPGCAELAAGLLLRGRGHKERMTPPRADFVRPTVGRRVGTWPLSGLSARYLKPKAAAALCESDAGWRRLGGRILAASR